MNDEVVTPLGYCLSELSIDPLLAKMLLGAVILGVLNPILIIGKAPCVLMHRNKVFSSVFTTYNY